MAGLVAYFRIPVSAAKSPAYFKLPAIDVWDLAAANPIRLQVDRERG